MTTTAKAKQASSATAPVDKGPGEGTNASRVHISRYTGIKTLFASSVDHKAGQYLADLEVTYIGEVYLKIHHGESLDSEKTELSFTPEQFQQFRALMLAVFDEVDRVMPTVEAVQFPEVEQRDS